MFPFASVFVSLTGSGVVFVTWTFPVPCSWTGTGFEAVFVTKTELTLAATADPHPVTNSTTVATETIVRTDAPHLPSQLMSGRLGGAPAAATLRACPGARHRLALERALVLGADA